MSEEVLMVVGGRARMRRRLVSRVAKRGPCCQRAEGGGEMGQEDGVSGWWFAGIGPLPMSAGRGGSEFVSSSFMRSASPG